MSAVLDTPLAPDLEALLAPIPGDDPAGATLRYDGTYDRVREARRADDPSLPQGLWTHELKRAEWPLVAGLCREALETRSKDLQLGAWLTEAWTGEHGFDGAAAGLAALLALCERYWDGAFPRGDTPDETAEARARVFEWLDGRLAELLNATPLTKPEIRPHHIIRRVIARVPATSPAPRARPVNACAAMAMASSARARKDQSVKATW